MKPPDLRWGRAGTGQVPVGGYPGRGRERGAGGTRLLGTQLPPRGSLLLEPVVLVSGP